MTTDYFAVYELPRRLTLDTTELQKKFYAKSREWHPDRFVTAPPLEQNRALDMTSALNDGYRTLRDPVQRAEYLLSLEGFDIARQRSSNVPPELLEEVFELNMMLEDAAGNRSELESARARFAKMLHQVDCDLESEFRHYDADPDRSVLSVIRSILNRRRYIENLLRDVDKALA
jgi:molecular chaperone HscB